MHCFSSLQEVKLERLRAGQAAADNFLESCVCLVVASNNCSPQALIADFMKFKKDTVMSKVGDGLIPSVVLLNWAAPCQIPVKLQEAQTALLTFVLNDEMQSVGMALSPVFSYTKGKLHLEETKMIKQLTQGNHSIDCAFSVIFKDQVDSRDERPMVYPGRLVFPSPVPTSKHTSASVTCGRPGGQLSSSN